MAFDVYEKHDLGEHLFVKNGSMELALSWLMSSGRTYGIRVRNLENGDVWTADEWIESLKVKASEPKTEFVPKYYRMNNAEEDLLVSGDYLRNGMKVLSCLDSERVRTDDVHMEDWVLDRALRNNRWCTVTQLERKDVVLWFTGVYDDGTKYVRTYRNLAAWYVKKDTIPPTPKEHQTLAIIKEAMEKLGEQGPDFLEDLAKDAANKISELP